MSQGLTAEQTFETAQTGVMEGELPTGDMFDRLAGLGGRLIDGFQVGFDTFRRKLPAATLAGGLVLTGAYDAQPAIAHAAPAATASHEAGTVLHRHSSLSPQNVLNRIHKYLHPLSGDFTQKRTEPILPTSAYLTPNRGGFRTACDNLGAVTFHYYKIGPGGPAFKTCGPGPLVQPNRTTPGEFQSPLNRVGRSIQKSVGLDYSEVTREVGGNRKKVTATYICPAVPSKGVKQIILRRAHHGSRTTVNMC